MILAGSMEYLAMFAVAAALEYINYNYSHSIAREDDRRTMASTVFGSGLGWLIILTGVRDIELAGFAYVGEIFGTFVGIEVRRGNLRRLWKRIIAKLLWLRTVV